jgi:hypothetical protein
MTRSFQGHTDSLVFYNAPTRRQKVARSRLVAVVIIVAVAASVGMIEQFSARASGPTASAAGPSTYFPR